MKIERAIREIEDHKMSAFQVFEVIEGEKVTVKATVQDELALVGADGKRAATGLSVEVLAERDEIEQEVMGYFEESDIDQFLRSEQVPIKELQFEFIWPDENVGYKIPDGAIYLQDAHVTSDLPRQDVTASEWVGISGATDVFNQIPFPKFGDEESEEEIGFPIVHLPPSLPFPRSMQQGFIDGDAAKIRRIADRITSYPSQHGPGDYEPSYELRMTSYLEDSDRKIKVEL